MATSKAEPGTAENARPSVFWSVCTVFVPLVMIATIAAHAVPRARGIAFVPQLRYALLTPACFLAAAGSVLLHRLLIARFNRPQQAMNACLAALAIIVLALLGTMGGARLMRVAAPTVFVVALALVFMVPRAKGRPRRLLMIVATVAVGVLEVAGVFAALDSERGARQAPDGVAVEVPRSLFDVEHRFVDLPGGARVHYVDEGRGETLLFLHGNPAWSFQWRDLIAALRGSFRCVALDYPGFGHSIAPSGFGFTPHEQRQVLEEFVDALALNNLTLVMQDWGARSASASLGADQNSFAASFSATPGRGRQAGRSLAGCSRRSWAARWESSSR